MRLLRNAAPFRWSETSTDVTLAGDALISADRLATLAGANTAALCHPSGAWEIIQFREATLIAARTYRLTGILRGQAGTEPLIETLPTGTRFVLINTALKRLSLTPDDIEREIYIRHGPATLAYDAEAYRAETYTPGTAGHRPYAPAHLRASEQGGTLTLTWQRRTRTGGDNWQTEPPLGEETEAYRVTITADGTMIEDTTTTSSAHTWSRTTTSPLTITVAQISAITGPGHAAIIEVP